MLDNLFSNEFVQFTNGLSPMAKQMIELFREGNTRRENAVGSTHSVIQQVVTWWKQEGEAKLRSIITNYTGIPYNTKCHTSSGPDFGYATSLQIDKDEGVQMIMILERASGRPANSQYQMMLDNMNSYIATADDFKKIIASYSAKTGKFRDVTLSNKAAKINGELYFDPYSAFLLKDTLHEDYDYLLPEEVAAIVIHEVGHIVSALLFSVDYWFVENVRNQAMSSFLKNASIKEKLKLAKLMSGEVHSGYLQKIMNKIDEMLASNRDDSFFDGRNPLVPILLFLLYSFFFLLPNEVIWWALKIPFALLEPLYAYYPDKLGDYQFNTRNVKYYEQLADSYAVRHGLGSYLSSALTKITNSPLISSESSRKTISSWLLSKALFLALAVSFGDMSKGDEHEGLFDRSKSVMFDSINAMKNTDLSPDLKKFYLKDYERCRDWMTVKMPLFQKTLQGIYRMHDFVDWVISTPVRMMFTANFKAEYDRMYRQIQALTSNDLYYQATKLETL